LLTFADVGRYQNDYPGAQIFTNVIDTLVSPHYPDNYEDYTYMRYVIKAPSKREIVLIFNDFDVEYEQDCDWDSLSVSTYSLYR